MIFQNIKFSPVRKGEEKKTAAADRIIAEMNIFFSIQKGELYSLNIRAALVSSSLVLQMTVFLKNV